MKYTFSIIIVLFFIRAALSQVTVRNTQFTLGTTGRVGVGTSPNGEGNIWKSLNLSKQGALAGRLEQADYVDLLPAFYFIPNHKDSDSSHVCFQARIGMYAANGQFIGNISSRTNDGLTIALPEAFIESYHILGSQWSAWGGTRYRRTDDIHICDYFYFDDHSAEGVGVSYKTTELALYMPASSDTSNEYPYNYTVSIDSTINTVTRQRMVWVGEHTLNIRDGNALKFLAEYHSVRGTMGNSLPEKYPSDNGWVLGVKYNRILKKFLPGSFNQFSVRYGTGIANGGDNGNSFTWSTFGAPNAQGKYSGAYSLAIVEHFLVNLTKKFTINGYGVFTHSKGGASSHHLAKSFSGSMVYNQKTDFVVGARSLYYCTHWLHLIHELHFAQRINGTDPAAQMWKFSFAPTIVPLGKNNPWCRPHIRLIYTLARYNDYARKNQSSPFLELNDKQWGSYLGIKTEWWLL